MSWPHMPGLYFDIDGNEIDQQTWATLYERKFRGEPYGRIGAVGYGDLSVSTIWLGLNHRYFGDGPPLIFETMVFGAPEGSEWCDFQRRYSTKEQAAAGHAEISSMVFRDVPIDELDIELAT